MKTRLFVSLVVVGVVAGTLVPTAAGADSPRGDVVAVTLAEDGYQTRAFAYVPDIPDVGSRATATPLLIVYGDMDYTERSARREAERSHFAEIATEEKGIVLFINSAGRKWEPSDQRSLVLAQRLFSDSTDNDYTAGSVPGTAEDGHFPGTRFRTYLFGDRRGADFISTELIDGVRSTHPYVTSWPSTLFPSSVFLSNPRGAVQTGEEGAEIPSFIVNGHQAQISALESVNQRIGEVGTTTTNRRSGFDASTVRQGYEDIVSAFYRRDSWTAPYASQLAPLPQWDELGVDVTREFADVAAGTYEHFDYVPRTIADAPFGTVPLVLLFHGSRNHAEWQALASQWPVIGSKGGFITVSVQDHFALGLGSDAMADLVDHVVREYPQIDRTKIYATGFSGGAAQSWSLGLAHTALFAGIAPTNGTFFTARPVDDLAIPTFYAAGPASPLPEFPSSAVNDVNTALATFFAKNGVTDDYSFDAASGSAWGIRPDRVATYDSPYFPDVQVDVSYYRNADGQEMIALADNLNTSHEPLEATTRAAWDFLQQFSRQPDGSIAVR